jgi:hypothetical protein
MLACPVQNGGFQDGAVFGSSVARSHTFSTACESCAMTWAQNPISVIGSARELVPTCRMRPGMRLGTIEHRYALSTS